MYQIRRKKAMLSLLAVAALMIATLGILVPKAHAVPVSITDVYTANDVVAQGFLIKGTTSEIHIKMPVYVVLVNSDAEGNQSVTVGIYADNVSASDKQAVELTPSETRTLTFLWDTFGVTLGNHTLSAAIDGSGEIFVDGQVQVIFPGDVNQDLKVDMKDAGDIVLAFNLFHDNPDTFNHFADLDGNGRIDLRDVGTWALNFGRTYTP